MYHFSIIVGPGSPLGFMKQLNPVNNIDHEFTYEEHAFKQSEGVTPITFMTALAYIAMPLVIQNAESCTRLLNNYSPLVM